MSYSPETEESLCTTCSEFWATITGKVFRYTKRGEEGTEVANEVGSACEGRACWRSKNLDPAGKAITYHEVMAAAKGEKVSEHGFKRGRGVAGRGGVAACVGAFQLQSVHPSLVLRISVDMPGQ